MVHRDHSRYSNLNISNCHVNVLGLIFNIIKTVTKYSSS